MELHGLNILGGEPSDPPLDKGVQTTLTFSAVNPATGKRLDPLYYEATSGEIDRAMKLAQKAFETYRNVPAEKIAGLLDTMADEITALGDELIQRANAETGLPEARLNGERGRTTGQLKMFAQLVREGTWVDARIDRALPDRKPLPRPDLRRMLVPIGPVVVFSASNFPLAFSAAGGDTAAALAAGNPVIVKAHPSHPGTSELVMRAVQKALEKCGMPAGLISLIHGPSTAVGLTLVQHPLTKAVGFTGSLQAGRALFNAAAMRPEPIPVYSEMGSTNPVFILPGAMAERGDEIAQGLVQSVTMGVGQFCTNPGLVFGMNGPKLQSFVEKVGQGISQAAPGIMLNSSISTRYQSGVEHLRTTPGVNVAARATLAADRPKAQAGGVVFTSDAKTFLVEEQLREELFGPSTVVIGCESVAQAEEIARVLPGQLTATIHGTAADLAEYRTLVELLVQKAGRVLYNGFPTGVEVSHAMQHGGPYPATTCAQYTSVGSASIFRFARPVCYQNFPQELLPDALKNKNARGMWRMIDGEMTRADV